MRNRQSIILLFKTLLLVTIIVSGLVFSSCTSGSIKTRGWSGVTIADDTLFVGSMDGRLVAVNTVNNTYSWAELMEVKEQASGFLGCTPTPTPVPIYGSPFVAGDIVYFAGYNGKIYAVSSTTRLSKDKYVNKKNQPIIGSPVVASGKVYVGSSDGYVYALDGVNLDMVWTAKTGGKVWSTPAISGDTLFIGSFDKKLYALNTATGEKKWEFETQGAIVCTPTIYNNIVYIGSFDRYLYAIDATTGSQKWKSMGGNWFWAKPVVYNGIVYAPCLDGKVHILDAQTGAKIVEAIDLESQINSSPVLAGNSVIVATENGVLYSLDTGKNNQRQLIDLKEKVYAPLATSQGIIYVHTANDNLYAVDAQSGTVRDIKIK